MHVSTRRLWLAILVGLVVSWSVGVVESAPLLPELGSKPTKIVCLGDSVTGVYYHTGGRRAYPEFLGIALERLYPGGMTTVVNAGISGNSTQNGLDRLDRDVLSQRPDLVTISFGLNDVVRHPLATFEQNLRRLVERCRAAQAAVVLCTPNMVVDTGSRPIVKIREYCAAIHAIGRETGSAVCDQFAIGEAFAKRDPWAWRLTMSDEIHPNAAGHQGMAEELCHTITGQRVSLAQVAPPTPILSKTWSLLRAGKPIKVLAMPPLDTSLTAALQTHFPNAKLEITPWPTTGLSLAQLEQSAKTLVRAQKPDLVLIAVPRTADALTDESFVRSYSWIMNWSLSFGQQEWDCLVMHPAVSEPGVKYPRDELVRQLVRAQHLHLLDRAEIDRSSPEQIVARFLADDRIAAETPIYADKTNLRQYYDTNGELQPVQTVEQWQVRARHTIGNLQRVMGALPPKCDKPLDVQVVHSEPLRHYTRQLVTYLAEPGDRAVGYLLLPHATPGSTSKRPAMICLPGSSPQGKDAPAGLGPNADMAYAHELAVRGYVCLLLDYPLLHTREYKTDPYSLGYASATLKGVVNHRRGVDLLAARPEVDPTRIGVVGHSLGGHNALFLAACDERVRAVVSSCGFGVFAKHNHGNVAAWSSRYYMPRIKTIYGDDPRQIPFDFTELLAALAPRAVFVNAPLHDEPDFEVSGVRDCLAAALPIYRDIYHAEAKLHAEYPDAGHTFPAAQRQAMLAFLDQHLAGQGNEPVELERGLLGHWQLKRDGHDSSPHARHATVVQNTFVADSLPSGKQDVAQFTGRSAHLEVPAKLAPRLGQRDFSVALWINSPEKLDDLPGDLLSQFDPHSRRGWQLSLKTNAGVTFNQANVRHLQFGIDQNRSQPWIDCGRPGEALLAFGLAVHEGALYAGTCEPGRDQRGRVYRYAGGQRWLDTGAPEGSNAVTALAVHNGRLYAGTGKYRVAGSALSESENLTLGGKLFRYEGSQRWTNCGQLPGAEAVGGLIEYRGRLYASSLYKPAGFFRYEQDQTWTDCGVPDEKRVEALCVFDGYLYASSYDGGRVYRFDGERWTDCGALGDNTQTYAFAVYQWRLHVGTWPSGRVYRFEDVDRWTDCGRLGEELEVMGMLVHNGRLLAGTLPLAQVYDYDGAAQWRLLTQLDATPDVKYRRAWTMAEHDGLLFCSTLPSGRIHAFEAGRSVAWERTFPTGWQHIVATRRGGQLQLFVNGQQVANSASFASSDYDLDVDAPLYIGRGMNDTFCGRMADVRLYDRALTLAEIQRLAQ
ncbi:MAG: dienelactone hydrolase family protein [Planctomycetaceae bacterium]|nr:dienelactone hydrolase family protein [Planctomycetaceae bacterium]